MHAKIGTSESNRAEMQWPLADACRKGTRRGPATYSDSSSSDAPTQTYGVVIEFSTRYCVPRLDSARRLDIVRAVGKDLNMWE